jgi:hypothetical protein
MSLTEKLSRFVLPALLLIFIVPALVGAYLYYYHDHFQFNTTNFGTLVRPAVTVDALAYATPAQQKWQIVYAPQTCDADAQQKMFVLHQLHTALGKDQDRVALTLLVTSANCELVTHDFRKVVFNAEQAARLQQALARTPAISTAEQIYLVDPLGNLFMVYAGPTDAMHVLKDLKKVLGVSQIG